MKVWPRSLWGLGMLASLGCRTPPQQPSPASSHLDVVEQRAIWRLALTELGNERVDTLYGPPDTTVYVLDTVRVIVEAPVPGADSSSSAVWLDSLRAQHLILGACPADAQAPCFDSLDVRRVWLTPPRPLAADSAYLTLGWEDGNRAACRAGHGRLHSGGNVTFWTRLNDGWHRRPAPAPEDAVRQRAKKDRVLIVLPMSADAVCGAE